MSEIQTTHKAEKRGQTTLLIQTAQHKSKPLQEFLQKFSNDWSMTFAGALAYSLLTAMLPIAIAVIAILGFVLGSYSDYIISQLNDVIPGVKLSDPAIQKAIHQVTNGAGGLAIISLILAIFGGSRLFVAVEGCMGIIYRVRPRPVVAQNLVAIAMMLLFIVLTPILVFASTLPGIILGFVTSIPSLKKIPLLAILANNQATTYLTGLAGGLIAAFLLFEAIYVVVPNQKISWPNSWRGALFSAIALQLFLAAVFKFYVDNFMKNYVGQIGFAVVLLVFFYYFAVILMLGAEINAFFFEKVRPLPNDLATFVSTMAGQLNKDIPEGESKIHVDAAPTEKADRAHIAEARAQEEHIQQQNVKKQRQFLAEKLPTPPPTKTYSETNKQYKKLVTILEVITGSVLAMLIQLLRLRQRHK